MTSRSDVVPRLSDSIHGWKNHLDARIAGEREKRVKLYKGYRRQCCTLKKDREKRDRVEGEYERINSLLRSLDKLVIDLMSELPKPGKLHLSEREPERLISYVKEICREALEAALKPVEHLDDENLDDLIVELHAVIDAPLGPVE